VSSLYNLVNVPSGVWIDEEGRVVRINEGTYSMTIKLGTGNFTIGTDEYRPAVRDWVLKGAASQHVWSADKVASKIRRRTADEALAEPTFKLGVYFFEMKNEALARSYWKRAQELLFTTEGSSGKTYQQKRGALGDKPYYAPLEIEKEKQPASDDRR
jgi:hypothetical protein